MDMTTIAIGRDVKNQILEFGSMGENYSDVILRLLKSANERLFHDFIMNQDSIPIEDVLKEFEEEYGN